MGAVKSGFDKVTGALVGGSPRDSYDHGDKVNDSELTRMANIESGYNNIYTQQNEDGIANNKTANDLLAKYLTSVNQGGPSQQDIQNAANYVDQTYTNPQKAALAQYQGDYQDQQNARAAAMGRNPNADIATQQAIYGEGQRNTINLQNQRAAMVQQQAQQNLSRLGQSAGYLNNLTQQAFSNRLQLLNGRSGLADYYQRERMGNRTRGGGGTSTGVLSDMTAINGGITSFKNSFPGGGIGQMYDGQQGGGGGGMGNMMGGGGMSSMFGGGGAAGGGAAAGGGMGVMGDAPMLAMA